MDTQTSSNSLVAMPTSRPSLDQVIQVIGGERTGEFAPAYMPEYAGLRALPAPMMYAPPQFAAPPPQVPQSAPERTFTQLKAPTKPAIETSKTPMYTGAPSITSQTVIGQTSSGELIYAIPKTPEQIAAEKKAAEERAAQQSNYSYGREGGIVNLANGGMVAQEAQGLASLGRGGDSMLVHMTPEEVSGLRSLALQQGTDLTINPDTGLPEAFKLKKLLRALAPIAPFFLGPAGGFFSTLAGKALASGIIGGFAAPGKGFNFKQGLKTGLMAYAGGTLAEGVKAQQAAQAAQAGTAGAAGTAGTAAPMAIPTETGAQFAPATTAAPSVDTAAALTPAATATTPMPSDAAIQAGVGGAPVGADVATQAALTSTPGSNVFPASTYAGTPPPPPAGAGAPAPNISAFERYTGVSPSTAMIGGSLLYGMTQSEKEEDEYRRQMEEQKAEDERKRRAGSAAFDLSLGRVRPSGYAGGGGIVALAGGGTTYMEAGGTTGPTGEPRMVRGTGDGMSDSVPASIEGVQEARLANDEFVIPADVVADIGNGSSNAGADKLYAMMDRIRKARHGTTKQPPEIRSEKYMPA
jgi:hypothetical protein